MVSLDLVYKCAYTILLNYQWDREKAKTNLEKHGISFADAVTVLSDDAALTVEDNDPDEQRFVTIGTDALGRVVVVVYTWRDEDIRVISARKATARERRQYEGTR
jgi:uncharacterized DUF497 family protein